MTSNDNSFQTEDIKLAAYLMSRDVRLLHIHPVNHRRCTYVFEKPDLGLLDAWLRGNAQADVRQVIDNYRHLLRQSHFREVRR